MNEFYCIVCEKFVQIPEQAIMVVCASHEYGGWYCGWHTQNELETARDKLGNRYSDINGKECIRDEQEDIMVD